ncbi:Ribosomal protein S6 modification protein [compost metagenome]|jgi:glutathione synthase/RimK-type ligase-like ATP-grasp enzyme|uniref:RimK domain-containing protein ATP-grasp n=1 Tax=Pseudomonas putida TRO1 TaxID=1227924 RepID=A0AAD2W956_PSEPU|nr:MULTISPECIES: RimK family alpha-L-glutamate ligase [Pseudomonas]ELS0924144.1 RimK family alpha-L-glutamate ligase [Pseudomonas putida]ENY75940.1 RimK domain-containing protein ATP-grasp [Pseudomonas putida TRO1]MCE1057232.1 RimK family alpha-L-glutamate ligase [Pseudomonas alloputida]MCF1250393.1 RimK family alpha-L-glutamate ligase [Pseudomonas putida]MDD2019475.1 RimK family alpha-L-glutamate ligase [Pseudomonas putida]
MSAVQANVAEVLAKTEVSTITLSEEPPSKRSAGNRLLIVVERKEDWASYFPSESLMLAQDYFEHSDDVARRTQVINLCRSYKYLGQGYYCSLLAEARGHKVFPSVRTISELTRKALYGVGLDDLERTLERALADHPYGSTEAFTLTLYFGRTAIEPLQDIGRQLFESFPCPVLLVEFRRRDTWQIDGIKAGALHKLRDEQQHLFADALDAFNRRTWRQPASKRLARFDLAILHDPAEALPPSNPEALEQFIENGKQLGIDVELIEKKDYARLAEFDALFIRETTRVDDHTYRFAKKAESEGLVVIDDPSSILRCTNKVYLADLLKRHNLGAPATEILYKDRPQELELVGRRLGFPLVLKIPDGCFSKGVIKVADAQALASAAQELFEHSVLLLAQEYCYTEYDWRIGVLNGEALYACQYFMSKGHWQIYNHKAQAGEVNGLCRAVPVEQAPPEVVKLAVDTARLIGQGLYGVDLKQTGDRVLVIEVNDNPNLDAGTEDAVLGNALYQRVLQAFVQRLERKHLGQAW